MSLKKLVGPLSVLGLLLGFLFAFEFFHETGPQVTRNHICGLSILLPASQVEPLLQLAAWTLPVLLFGSYTLACVPSEGFSRRGSYPL